MARAFREQDQDRRKQERHMELQGQVAIVTGAGRGIGRATGLELARMGADIVVAELDAATAERTASEVPQCLANLHRRNHEKPTGIY
jgi:NAD(P)-dependent dehydrogenase (short-subunit alcohol dehydrogenase family)